MTSRAFFKTTTFRMLGRYFVLEAGGKMGLLLGTVLIAQGPAMPHLPLALTASELLGYYGLAFASGLCMRRKAGVVLAQTLAEFGVAEVLDIVVVRSLCLALAMNLLGAPSGAWAGSLAADCVFYAVAALVRRWTGRKDG